MNLGVSRSSPLSLPPRGSGSVEGEVPEALEEE